MTNDEAIRKLVALQDGNGDTYEAIRMAIEALEQQIPKPVEFVTDYTWAIGNKQPICPECESDVSKIVFFPVDEVEAKGVSYCEFCGQALSREV